MESTTTVQRPARELDYRANEGIEVWLLWHPDDDRLTVEVADSRCGEAFRLSATAETALDVFHHPYAYGASHGAHFLAVEADALAHAAA
jgi:hypothetical protein